MNGKPLTRFTRLTSNRNPGFTRKLPVQKARKTALKLEHCSRDRLGERSCPARFMSPSYSVKPTAADATPEHKVSMCFSLDDDLWVTILVDSSANEVNETFSIIPTDHSVLFSLFSLRG